MKNMIKGNLTAKNRKIAEKRQILNKSIHETGIINLNHQPT